MKYTYQKAGETKQFDFPFRKAPQEYNGYRKIIAFPAVHFKGLGFTTNAFQAEHEVIEKKTHKIVEKREKEFADFNALE